MTCQAFSELSAQLNDEMFFWGVCVPGCLRSKIFRANEIKPSLLLVNAVANLIALFVSKILSRLRSPGKEDS